MEISLVPEIINAEQIKFKDLNGLDIEICEPSDFLFNSMRFKKPFILIDIFEKRKYKKIDIRRIGIDQLEDIGFRIVSLKTTAKLRNRPRQNKSYVLQPMSASVFAGQIIMSMPIDHSIEYDIANNRIRLKGSNVYPYNRNENATPWIEVQSG